MRRKIRSVGYGQARVIGWLRKEAKAKRLLPGERLPSERRLAEAAGASRDTVRKALALLEREGLIEPVEAGTRSGWVVRLKPGPPR